VSTEVFQDLKRKNEKEISKKEKKKPVHFLSIFHLEKSVEMKTMTTYTIDKEVEER